MKRLTRALTAMAVAVMTGAVLAAASPFEGAHWIGENPQPVYGVMTNAYTKLGPGPRLPKTCLRLRRVFRLPAGDIRSAVAQVTGLGAYELHVNGKNVQPDRLLAPSWSNPDFRVHYDAVDVKSALVAGRDNAVGFWLAPGYSDDFDRYGWRWLKSQRALLALDVVYEDGRTFRLVTDKDWEWTDRQPLTFASIYHGERYVAEREDPCWSLPQGSVAVWRPVALLDGPTDKLRLDQGPSVTFGPAVRPVRTWRTASGRKMFDFGGNCSAIPELRAKLPRGAKATLYYTEEIKDGELDFRSHRGLVQHDEFTAAGTGREEVYRPHFTYHGFRYVGVDCTGDVDVVVHEVTTRMRELATFDSSDEMLNWLWDASRRSMRANFVAYPSDCNMRTERTPCLMDSNVYEDTALQVYDSAAYYRRWLFDAVRYQYGFGRGEEGGDTWNPDWQGEPILLAERLLTHCAATNAALCEYAGLVKIADRFVERSPQGVWEKGGFGDWVAKNDGNPFACQQSVNTMLLAVTCRAMARLAELKGVPEDAARFARHARLAEKGFSARFLDRETGRVGGGSETEQALALAFGLVPEELRERVVAALASGIRERDGTHFTTGVYGTRWIGDAMLENGLGELWLEMMHNETYPGFGFMRAQGATSLWEEWKPYGGAMGMQSHNHAMRAGAISCFLSHLGGIRPLADGYASVLVKPVCPKGLERVTVSRELPKGRVTVSWRRVGGKVLFAIDGPKDLPIRIELPPDGQLASGGQLRN